MKSGSKKRGAANLSQFVQDFVELELKMLQPPTELTSKNILDPMWLGSGSKGPNAFAVIYRMMNLLYPDKRPTMGELRRAVSLPSSSATRVMDFLVKNGNCRRLPDTNDRRIVRVALTSAGRRNLRVVEQHATLRSKEILSALTPEEQITFLNLFRKIVTSPRKDGDISKEAGAPVERSG